MNQTNTESTESSSSASQDLSELPFNEYEAARKAGTSGSVEVEKSATDLKSDQNESSESDTEENDSEEQLDEAEEKELDSDSKDLDDKPKKKSGFQRRIDKLNAAKAKVQQEADFWREQALKGAGEPKTESKKADSTPATAEGEPNPENYDTHSEFVRDLTRWEIKQAEKIRDQEAEQSRLKSEREKAAKTLRDGIKSFKETHDDFDDVVESVDDVLMSPVIQQAILSSDNGPELMYELAKNRAEYERINSLEPVAAARAIGRLEAKLSAESTEKRSEPVKTTKAPKPLAPVGKGSGLVTKSLNDPSISFEEYERLRMQQLKSKR